jgi:hypothetical protein
MPVNAGNLGGEVKPMPVSFQQLGIFPAPGVAVFTGSVVTQELLAL